MRQKSSSISWTIKATVVIAIVLVFAIAGFIVGQRSRIQAEAGGSGISSVQSATAGSGRSGGEGASANPSAASQTDGPGFDLMERPDSPPTTSEEEFVAWMLQHTNEDEEMLAWRWNLSQDLQSWGMITDERMLEAFLRTPREHFCREWNLTKAYLDIWMNIGYGVTITDPSVVCRMTETIMADPDEKVLEIGTGSGYQAAILSNLSNNVYTIEIIEELAKETDELYRSLEPDYPSYTNIRRKVDDGYYGWPEHAPFDRVIVTCSIDHIPPILIRQLAPDGIMIIPVGPPGTQTLLKVTKRVDDDGTVRLERADVWGSPVTFVPFKDKAGKKHTMGAKE